MVNLGFYRHTYFMVAVLIKDNMLGFHRRCVFNKTFDKVSRYCIFHRVKLRGSKVLAQFCWLEYSLKLSCKNIFPVSLHVAHYVEGGNNICQEQLVLSRLNFKQRDACLLVIILLSFSLISLEFLKNKQKCINP